MNTVGDLQGGIEEAELLLGYKVLRRVRAGHHRQVLAEARMIVPILKQGTT